MMKPRLEGLLVTPSCVTALGLMNKLPHVLVHTGTKSMSGVLFQEKMKEDHHSCKVPRRCLYPVKKVLLFVLNVIFGSLLLLILNLSLKYPRTSSVILNTECDTLQLQNFKSNVSIFFRKEKFQNTLTV